MNKGKTKKLLLNKETLRNLQDSRLRQVIGGQGQPPIVVEEIPNGIRHTMLQPGGCPCFTIPPTL